MSQQEQLRIWEELGRAMFAMGSTLNEIADVLALIPGSVQSKEAR